jgi:hypothetical protein
MSKNFNIDCPQKDFHTFNRLYSSRNVFYYTQNYHVIHEKINIDTVDKNLRILCLILLQNGASIIGMQAASFQEKHELEDIYNAVKADEKAIRSEGIVLNDLEGKEVEYLDKNYRIRFPSFAAFENDYVKLCQNQYISFAISRTKNAHLFLKNKEKFENTLETIQQLDKIIYTIRIDSSEIIYSEPMWRRYTQIVVDLYKNERQI